MKKYFVLCALLLGSLSSMAQVNREVVDRGFRHPGGLHSQQDFERVKQQVADNEPIVKKAYDALVAWGKSNTDTGVYIQNGRKVLVK